MVRCRTPSNRGGEDTHDPPLAKRAGIFGHYVVGDIDRYHVSYFAVAEHRTPTVSTVRTH